jgi:hypothetical protein
MNLKIINDCDCIVPFSLSGLNEYISSIKRRNAAYSKLINKFPDKFTIENFFW